MTYGIVLTYTVAPRWLALSRDERNAMRAAHLEPVFAAFADRVRARFFDAEAFSGRCSDFVVLETEDLGAYYFLVEALRDTPVIAEGYLTFGEIFVGVEDGFEAYEAYERTLAGGTGR
ncbi:darcynin family protein [Streptomyces huiliensis]|uniref:darcynin family protein n=1 Tax=Streptomyces huiliensis TaxID=2876027 RepID=UPI001CBCCE20|nr:darcynin family protein [Streptomyces huiliensis]MBZ4321052.1 darcynin [Streptomyces huiliensis]